MQPLSRSCTSKPKYHIMTHENLTRRDSALEDAIDHSSLNPTLQTVNVMSVSRSMNKTLMAVSLAKSYARAGYKTLLLEVNFRHSFFPTFFDLDANNGFSYWAIDDVLPVNTLEKNLDVLASGSVDDNVSHYLVSRGFKQRIHALRSVYEKIVIDTPSLAEHLDALITVDYACGSIIIHDA